MTAPLHTLAGLLRAPAATPGQVLSVAGSTARIATPGGAVLASMQGTLKAGDRCSITAGIARKTPASTHTYAL